MKLHVIINGKIVINLFFLRRDDYCCMNCTNNSCLGVQAHAGSNVLTGFEIFPKELSFFA